MGTHSGKVGQFIVFGLALAFALCTPCAAESSTRAVHVMRVVGSINPGVAIFVERAVADAEEADAECLIIMLDTPGGLADSMRAIVQSMLESTVVVVVYVAPAGARAASAGVVITLAAHVAAMAPGTNIGAAHPVPAGGGKMDETMSKKVENDMVAYVRSIAEEKGRNADWAEKAVRESVSITAEEALKKKVVDLRANDLDDLLKQLDGRTVSILSERKVLKTSKAEVVRVEEELREKILRTIADPNIAYILMMLGFVGLYFELSSPGAIFPGIVGAVSLILAFFAFQTLPVNYAGILLILLGLVLFVLELKVVSFGMLTVGGISCLVLGSLFLFKGDDMGLIRVSWGVLLATVAVVTLFFTVVVGLVVRAMLRKPVTGSSGLMGELGQVTRTAASGEFKIFVHGETWDADGPEDLAVGDKVEVTEVTGLRLRVRKANR